MLNSSGGATIIIALKNVTIPFNSPTSNLPYLNNKFMIFPRWFSGSDPYLKIRAYDNLSGYADADVFSANGSSGVFVGRIDWANGTVKIEFNELTDQANLAIQDNSNANDTTFDLKAGYSFYEMLIYEAALTAPQIATIKSYLQTKHSL
jgi:hypothetical protein